MSMRSWIRGLFARPATRPIRKVPRRARLGLEALEERAVPATFTVLNGLDDGDGSLRAAIAAANDETSNPGHDDINFDSGVTAVSLTTGQLTISSDVSITGPGANLLSISGGGLSRVFAIDPGASAELSGLTISGGNAGTTGNGGGLSNFGNTTLENCTLSGNFAGVPGGSVGGYGGAVYGGADSTTTLTACTVSGNTAVWGGGLDSHGTLTLNSLENDLGTPTLNCFVINNVADHGGGLENYLGTTTLDHCTVSGNTSTVSGGGLFLVGGKTTLTNYCVVSGNEGLRGGGISTKNGTVELTDCTVSGNTARTLHGGGVYNDHSTMTLTNCTISGNSAVVNSADVQGDGGGLLSYGGQTTLTNCTVSGNSSYRGAGLFAVLTTVQLVNSTVSGNTTTGGSGGGVYNDAATVTIQNCTISGNSAVRFGGALFNFGTTTLTGSTLSGNSAGILGGGVGTTGGPSQVALTNCTIAGNSAPEGGGLWLCGTSASALATATLVNCTVSGNSATCGVGGGLGRNLSAKVTLGNTIVAGNTATESAPDVYGPVTSQGYNLIGKTDSNCVGLVSTDLRNVNPLLAPLGNYGGPLVGAPGSQQVLQTMALLPGSLAIDAGKNSLIPAGITTDQRGLPRKVNTTVDIGAFESSGFTIVVVSGGGQSAVTSKAFQSSLVVQVTANNSLEPVAGGLVTFTAPTSGASASFNGTTATISATGTASVTATANGSVGSYTVTAAARGIANSVIFSLTNKKKGT
jgi:hypothetical protein